MVMEHENALRINNYSSEVEGRGGNPDLPSKYSEFPRALQSFPFGIYDSWGMYIKRGRKEKILLKAQNT